MEKQLLQPGEKVGIYTIVKKVGQGGMGEVYEAFEEGLQRRIALKILTKEASSQPDLVRRFKVEGRSLARLEHGNIVRVYTLDEHNGQVFMAMEYIEGWTLDEYLRTHYYGLHDIMRIARQLLEGLAAAHSASIVHRDIKPQNIMIDKNLTTKLLDFGIAKLAEDNGGVNTVTGVMFGTLNYIAPEIFNGGGATKQSDIYSLGLVLYLMFSGKSPFIAKTRLEIIERVANTKVAFPSEANAILPNSLKRVIYRMIAKNPVDRYQSARDALMDLERVNLNVLPSDLRPALARHMNITCSDELRAKCTEIGLEYFETRLVVCLAAEITLKSQTWGGQENIVLTPQAMTQAARRYVFAKRQMMVKNAYEESNFKFAVGGLITAVALAVVVAVTAPTGSKTVSAPPVAEVKPAAVAPPPVAAVAPVVEPAKPSDDVLTPPPVAADTKLFTPIPPPATKPAAEPTPAVSAAEPKPVKVAQAPKPAKKAKLNKKPSHRSPAAISKAELPPAKSEPDFLSQKPVLLPTVIDRKNRN